MSWILFFLWIILISIFEDYFWSITIGIIVFYSAYYFFNSYISDFKEKARRYDEIKPEFDRLKGKENELNYERQTLYQERKELEKYQQEIHQWVEHERNF